MRRNITVFFIVLLVITLTAGAIATAGTQADPVVTLSYITSTYQPYILSETDEMISEIMGESYELFEQKLNGLDGDSALYAAIYLKNTNLADKTVRGNSAPVEYTLKKGSIVTGAPGTQFVISSGSAAAYAPDGGEIVDTTRGEAVYHGAALSIRSCYMAVDEGSYGIMVTADNTTVTVSDTHRVIGVILNETSGIKAPSTSGNSTGGTTNVQYTPQYVKYAQALNAMGLFKGSNSGFSLDRSATRVEAIVMLIRLLGEEDQALAYTGTHPFTDVPAWADKYVAYAYNMGYTTGTSATLFGSSSEVTQAHYLTFVLRALGYDDAAGDFVWNKAADKCVAVGVLTQNEIDSTSQPFYRDQMTYCSYRALYANLKDSKLCLIDNLILSGSVTYDMVSNAVKIVS